MSTMARRTFVSGMGVATTAPTLAWAAAKTAKSAGKGGAWRDLWDGKTLKGWSTYLRGATPADPPLGLDNDPRGVFSVAGLDGAPAIRISGEVWGAFTTAEEFENYHFRIDFKWGEKRWPPRESAVRDSGILYHCVGPHGAGSKCWMRSFELQVEQGDCGDFHSVDGVIVDVEGVPPDPAKVKGKTLIYKKGTPVVKGVAHRIIKAFDAEKPYGEWNTAEVVAVKDTAVHIVNGKVVMVLTGLRHKPQKDGPEAPLTRGRIQLQSEGAEVFYRKPQVRPLREIPPGMV